MKNNVSKANPLFLDLYKLSKSDSWVSNLYSYPESKKEELDAKELAFVEQELQEEGLRAQKIVTSAFRNPYNQQVLSLPDVFPTEFSSDILVEAVGERILRDSEPVKNNTYENLYTYDFISVDSNDAIEEKIKDCSFENECCLATSDMNIQHGKNTEKIDEKYHFSVLALYSSGEQQSNTCAETMFAHLVENQEVVNHIRNKARAILHNKGSLSEDSSYRIGGLLPKIFAPNVSLPLNNYKKTPSCSITLAYPSAKREFLEPIAEHITKKIQDLGIDIKSAGLDKNLIEDGQFTILLDTEMFYTASLYKYLLPDLSLGRDEGVFGNEENCGTCFLIARERELKGSLPYYYDAGYCDRYAQNWGAKCGIEVKDPILKNRGDLLVKIEEEFQKSSKNKIFHLFYFAPSKYLVNANLMDNRSCLSMFQ